MKQLILCTLLLCFSIFLSNGQGFEILPPAVWENDKFKNDKAKLDEYSYASVDIIIVNYQALLKLKFNNPPGEDATNGEKRRWRKEANERIRYFGITLNFPSAPQNPWSKELILPLYFFDTEDNDHLGINIQQQSTIIDNIPRINAKYRTLNAKLNLEKHSVNQLQAAISKVSNLAFDFISDPVALTTPALIGKIAPVIGDFKNQMSTGKKEYMFSYGLQILPFGTWKRGLIRQVDTYTIKPTGETKAIPSLTSGLDLKNANDVISNLNNVGSPYTQVLVVYRVSNFNFEDFNTSVTQSVIDDQELTLSNLIKNEFISKEESNQLSALIDIKKEILALDKDRTAYYDKIKRKQSYCADLINTIGHYYNVLTKVKNMKDAYDKTDLYKDLNSRNSATLKSIADSYLTFSEDGRTLESAKRYVESLTLLDLNISKGAIDLLYSRLGNLKFVDSEELTKLADYANITISPFYKDGKKYRDLIEKEILIQKYQSDIETLSGANSTSEEKKVLRSKLKIQLANETSEYCIKEVNAAIETYDKAELVKLKELEAKKKEYNQMILDIKQLNIELAKQENCLSKFIEDVNNGLDPKVLEIYKQYFKDYSAAKEAYVGQLKQALSEADLKVLDKINDFLDRTKNLKNDMDQKGTSLKKEVAFSNCFTTKID